MFLIILSYNLRYIVANTIRNEFHFRDKCDKKRVIVRGQIRDCKISTIINETCRLVIQLFLDQYITSLIF